MLNQDGKTPQGMTRTTPSPAGGPAFDRVASHHEKRSMTRTNLLCLFAVLAMLYTHAEQPEIQCRFRWTRNTVALWDNRCVQHHAMWDYHPQVRSGFRVSIVGERPV